MKRLLKYITLLGLLMLPVLISAQSGEPRNKHHEKAEKKREKGQEKAEKQLLKNHEKIQTKETRQRMKKNKKKSKRIKNGKGEDPFYKRLFRKK